MSTDFDGLQPQPEMIGQASDAPPQKTGRATSSAVSTMAKAGGGAARGNYASMKSRSSEQLHPPTVEEVFVASALFEMGCGVVIFLSVLAIAWEIDDVFSPQFRQFLESAVTGFFLAEWLVRLKASGCRWLLDPVVMFDTFLVWVPGVLAVWILQPSVQDGATDFLKVVRTIRMLRLLRIVLFFKHFKAFQDLFKLVRGLLSSGSTLLSAMGLIAATLYAFAIFAIDLIGNQDFAGASSDVLEAQGQFKGIFTTMITLMRFMHGDDCQGVLDVLTTRQPWIWVFLWLFTSLSSYVLLNLVTAVIVQQALEMSSADEADLALQLQQQREEDLRELEATFKTLDEDQSGQVSLEEFMQAFKIKEVKTKMTLLGLKEAEMLDLFRLLDTDGEGELSLEEFMQGMSQLKGEAKSKDMLLLEKSVERLGVKLRKLTGYDPADLEFKNAFDKEKGTKLRQTFEQIRDNIDERLTQAEQEVQEVVDLLARLSEEFAALPPGLDVKKLLAKEEPQAQAAARGPTAATTTQRGSFVGSLVSESTVAAEGEQSRVQRGSLFSEASSAPPRGNVPPASTNRGSLFSEESAAPPAGAEQLATTKRGSLFSDASAGPPAGAQQLVATKRGSLFSDASAGPPAGARRTSDSSARPRGARPSSSKRRGSLFSDSSAPPGGERPPTTRGSQISDGSLW